jgi:hypothetical protein
VIEFTIPEARQSSVTEVKRKNNIKKLIDKKRLFYTTINELN